MFSWEPWPRVPIILLMSLSMKKLPLAIIACRPVSHAANSVMQQRTLGMSFKYNNDYAQSRRRIVMTTIRIATRFDTTQPYRARVEAS